MQFAPQKQKALSGGPGERLQTTNIGADRSLSRGTKALKAAKWSRDEWTRGTRNAHGSLVKRVARSKPCHGAHERSLDRTATLRSCRPTANRRRWRPPANDREELPHRSASAGYSRGRRRRTAECGYERIQRHLFSHPG